MPYFGTQWFHLSELTGQDLLRILHSNTSNALQLDTFKDQQPSRAGELWLQSDTANIDRPSEAVSRSFFNKRGVACGQPAQALANY